MDEKGGLKMSDKLKISADCALNILKGIMKQFDYPISSDDEAWNGKSVMEALNIEYYPFRHNPNDTDNIIKDLMDSDYNSLNKSFCIFTIDTPERLFSKVNDVMSVSANLEIWLQSSKIEMLEDFIEELQIRTIGQRLPVQIDDNYRRVIMTFSKVNVGQVVEVSEFGEMVVCDITVDYIFYPNIAGHGDYVVWLAYQMKDDNPDEPDYISIPFANLAVSTSYTQKPIPFINNPASIGNINLSKVTTFVLGFEGYLNNDFIDWLVTNTLQEDNVEDDGRINIPIYLKIERADDAFTCKCLLKSHDIKVQEGTENEVHSIVLDKRWING